LFTLVEVSVIFLFLFLLLFIAYAWQMVLLRRRWKDLEGWEIPLEYQPKTRVTVLVPARNEATQIRICLQALQAQTYPTHLLQLILIDDHSSDDTVALAQGLHLDNLEILQLPSDQKGKKGCPNLRRTSSPRGVDPLYRWRLFCRP
jgi:cellulose synthase/poly-beta-1,6-N-acetylglucosamine synthase-like glycosyltransferase